MIIISHKPKPSLRQQVQDKLSPILKPGSSRHEAKKVKEAQNYIYSYQTYNNYKHWCNQFVDWCKENYRCKTLQEAREHVDDYLRTCMTKYAASTITSYKSAIAKLYGCSTTEFIATPTRHRADFVRSRKPAKRDKHISEEKNADLFRFVLCTGLRRSELSMLNGNEYRFHDGVLYVHVRQGKGGKQRDARVIGTEEDINFVLQKMRSAGNGRVFKKIHSAFDQHSVRAAYAARFYKQIARPVGTLSHDELYFCRKDMKGLVLDKKAMLTVSQSLGHERISVIAENYSYYLKQEIEK